MTRSILYTLICIGCAQWMQGQQSTTRLTAHQQHAWFVGSGLLDIHPKWSIFYDVQARRESWGADLQQNLYRIGLFRKLSNNQLLGGGYAFVHTGVYGELPVKYPFDEHRGWLQFQTKQLFAKGQLTHRYRAEFRWIDPERNLRREIRARYMVRYQHTWSESENTQWYTAVYDEVFVNMGKDVAYNIFDQNRFGVVMGRKFNRTLSLELGYLNQCIMQRSLTADGRNKMEDNDTVLMSLIWNWSPKKKTP